MKDQADDSRQTADSVEKNARWFRENIGYRENVERLDTYQRIRRALDIELSNPGRVLDIGNGGVFDYDVSTAQEITALDLFLDGIDTANYPAQIRFVQGSALDVPFPDASFDTVVIVLLLHHLVGPTVAASRENARRSITEARRVLRAGGRLVLVESCVPHWFYRIEQAVFGIAARVIGVTTDHPLTLQYPIASLSADVRATFGKVHVEHIPKGRTVLQFGVPVPSMLTPVEVYVLTASA